MGAPPRDKAFAYPGMTPRALLMVLVSHVAEDTNMASIGDFVGKDEDFVDFVAEWLT